MISRDGEMVAASGSKPERNNGNQEGAADTLGTSVARAGSSPAPDTIHPETIALYRSRIAERREALGGDTYAHAKPGEKWADVRRMTKVSVRADILEALLDAYEALNGGKR